MLAPGERVLVGGQRRQGLARRVGPAARARLRGRRPVHRSRHRRLQRRQRRVRRGVRRRPRADAAHDRPARTTTATTCRPRRRATRRVPCSACGLSKRHLFDGPRATAATTSSPRATTSTTRRRCCSATRCAGTSTTSARQLPVLPAGGGFPRKVKPLVRLTERETAAWCIVRGIDYQVEECPMAAGNRHLGYKATLNALEAGVARHEGVVLPRLPRADGAAAGRHAPRPTSTAPRVRPLRRADDRRGVRVLPARRDCAAAHEPVPGRAMRRRRPAAGVAAER